MAKKEITFGGWYSPILDAETAKKIKDCSLDYIFFVGDAIGHNCKASKDIERSLEFCDVYGINAYVQKGKDVDVETALSFEKRFSEYKSYLGLLLYDEPTADYFDTLFEDWLVILTT